MIKPRSVEQLIIILCIFLLTLLVSAIYALNIIYNLKSAHINASIFMSISTTLILYKALKKYTITPLNLLSIQVDAMRNQEFLLRTKSQVSKGVLYNLHSSLCQLSDELQENKDLYNQHVLMIYKLIENINTPILILDKHSRLIHANHGFKQVYLKPWEELRYADKASLFLRKTGDKWEFITTELNEKWQIRSSQLKENKNFFQMLIITNIQNALKEVRQKSWEQLIRVLSHEVRNSLTPITSLSQTLYDIPEQTPETKEVLNVILERSYHLMSFIDNYSHINKSVIVNKDFISSNKLIDKLSHLFTLNMINSISSDITLFIDLALFEQALINLVKNAIESCELNHPIEIIFIENNNESIIKILDRGKGIANENNIFTPFYTTKTNGQGVGLSLSRHIIEEHGGTLNLANRIAQRGAEAVVTIPRM